MFMGYKCWALPAEWQKVLDSPEPEEFLHSITTLLCPYEELASYSDLDQRHGEHEGAPEIRKFPDELVNSMYSKHLFF
jgi:hypothetical protein